MYATSLAAMRACIHAPQGPGFSLLHSLSLSVYRKVRKASESQREAYAIWQNESSQAQTSRDWGRGGDNFRIAVFFLPLHSRERRTRKVWRERVRGTFRCFLYPLLPCVRSFSLPLFVRPESDSEIETLNLKGESSSRRIPPTPSKGWLWLLLLVYVQSSIDITILNITIFCKLIDFYYIKVSTKIKML